MWEPDSRSTGNLTCIIDPRAGSEDLLTPLKKLGVDCEFGHLEYGDVNFLGNGPDGCPVNIGIEYKKIMDVLKCVIDGRFAGHQLPGLITSYHYAWLLVEGAYRADMHSGALHIRGLKGYFHQANIGGRAFMYKDLMSWFNTMDMRGGMRIARTYDRTESVFWLASLYHWWTDKSFDEHKSHLAARTTGDGDRAVLVRPSLMRRMAACLPGIGWDKSGNVCRHFTSVQQMVMASRGEWEQVDGIGKTLSEKIVRELEG